FDELNALSFPDGFIVVHPTLLLQLRSLSESSDFIDEFVFYHEFGHQLQFWADGRYFGDPTARRRELQADCVAGTLGVMTRINRDSKGGLDELQRLIDPVLSSASAAGDFQFEAGDHHGTPLERSIAVSLGATLVLKQAMDLADPTNELGVVGRTLGFFTATLTTQRVL